MREDQELVDKQAGDFWNSSTPKQQDMAHWRGIGRWRTDGEWLSIGQKHLRMFRELRARHCQRDGEMRRMIEWGTGGGCNVLAFAEEFEEIVGVDLSTETLNECHSQARKHAPGLKFVPFPISIDNPEAIKGQGEFDFFLTTAVIQHMPSHEWVERCLSLVAAEMREYGQALVQFRIYRRIKGRRKMNSANTSGPYNTNVARWCVFHPDNFIALCDRSGWHVLEIVGKKTATSGYMFAYLEKK